MENNLRYHLIVIPSPRSHRSNVLARKAVSSISIQKDKSKIIYKLMQSLNLTPKRITGHI